MLREQRIYPASANVNQKKQREALSFSNTFVASSAAFCSKSGDVWLSRDKEMIYLLSAGQKRLPKETANQVRRHEDT